MKRGTLLRFAKATLACLLTASVAFGLAGCKPTDLFTEVVIKWDAETVDENNPDKATVNSPDAQEESTTLSALTWADSSTQSQDVQNLVVYSSDPNTLLSTHHSIFDLAPLFPGIEASDGVRLVYGADSDIDNEADATDEDEEPPDADSTSTGGREDTPESQASPRRQAPENAQTIQSQRGEQGDVSGGGGQSGNSQGGSQSGGSQGGSGGANQGGNTSDPNNQGGGSGQGDEGDEPDPYAGYDGTVRIYNPGDAFAQVQKADHIAVLGSDVSVMAQAIGGSGAVCAMSDYAYRGLDSSGRRTSTYSYFGEVFANEAGSIKFFWSRDGSSPSDVSNIGALVDACGKDGVIVYDQRLGDQTTLFSDAQRKELYAANIQLVPVDLSTVQGLLDAATVIGDALSESSESAQDSKAMARAYVSAVGNIVKASAATHGGTYVGPGPSSSAASLYTTYYNCPVSGGGAASALCYIATAAEGGLTYASGNLDVSGVVLFAASDPQETPLAFYAQAAGVWDGTMTSYTKGLTVLWPVTTRIDKTVLTGGASGGAWSQWLGTEEQASAMARSSNGSPGGSRTWAGDNYGLGSAYVPYLIVCATDGYSALQVRDAVVESMGSARSLYSVRPYSGEESSIFKKTPTIDMEQGLFSSIGAACVPIGSSAESPFYSTPALSRGDVVRENPCGLLGSWTEGSMESVLEAAWLADLYSASPEGCSYQPVTSMEQFSVTIGNQTCKSVREAVLAFYETFYRVDASEAYGRIVTDEGLANHGTES